MIGIIDYGRGNLRSVEKALQMLGFQAAVFDKPGETGEMTGLILPGVGAFADAMASLKDGGWFHPIRKFAASGRPFLGICLGMQLLFEIGEEHGSHEGLGLLPGRVIKFPATNKNTDIAGNKIPHMGWNNLIIWRDSPLFEGIPDGAWFYFVHSYYAETWAEKDIMAACDYIVTFPAVVGWGNVFGTQFHPEKSSPWGLKLLDNFGKMVNDHAALPGD